MRSPESASQPQEKHGLSRELLVNPFSVNTLQNSRRLRDSLSAIALIFFAATAFAEDPFTGTWKISDARTLTGKVLRRVGAHRQHWRGL